MPTFLRAPNIRLRPTQKTRLAVIEKSYQPLEGAPAAAMLVGRESIVAAVPLMGDPDLEVRSLLPDSPAFDFAVNTMTYQPGAALSMVEMHVMEHGLLMLEGGGIYRFGDSVVSRAGGRLHLDGGVLSAVVWRDWQAAGKVSDL